MDPPIWYYENKNPSEYKFSNGKNSIFIVKGSTENIAEVSAPAPAAAPEPVKEKVQAKPVAEAKPAAAAEPPKPKKEQPKKAEVKGIVIPTSGKLSDEDAEEAIKTIIKRLNGRVPKDSKGNLRRVF